MDTALSAYRYSYCLRIGTTQRRNDDAWLDRGLGNTSLARRRVVLVTHYIVLSHRRPSVMLSFVHRIARIARMIRTHPESTASEGLRLNPFDRVN